MQKSPVSHDVSVLTRFIDLGDGGLSASPSTGSHSNAKTPKVFAHNDLGKIAILTLSRPDRANAFDRGLILELIQTLTKLHKDPNLRLVFVHGIGPHFCAGADLEWMQSSAKLSYEDNLMDASLLADLFSLIKDLPVPTIGYVHGSVMGGGVGLAACLDIVIAHVNTKFALSEVKLGLAPAVIMPFLADKISRSFLRQVALSGQIFAADTANDYGLVQQVVSTENSTESVLKMVEAVLLGAPSAQRSIKKMLNSFQLTPSSLSPESNSALRESLVSLIATLRTSAEGQAGLKAFFDKRPQPWKTGNSWHKAFLDILSDI